MSRRIGFVLLLVSLMASGVITIQPIKANSRTIIVPDDYPTIAEAIGNATDGDTILVRKGTYEGTANQTLIINKTISLIGEDANITTMKLHPLYFESFIMGQSIGWNWADAIQIVANDVKISGFTIASDGGYVTVNGNKTMMMGNIVTAAVRMNGFYQTFAHNLLTASFYPNGSINSYGHIETDGSYGVFTANSVVKGSIGVYGTYNTISSNNVVEGNMGTGDDGTTGSNFFYSNILSDGGDIGLASSENIVVNNTITNSSWGGVSIIRGGNNIVYRNTITNCPEADLSRLGDPGSDNTFYANYVAFNSWGAKIAYYSPGYGTRLYHNNFVNNVKQVNCDLNETFVVAGMNFTRQLYHAGVFDNGTEGNYWSDYNGTDANSDGVGDTPYVIDANRADQYPLMSAFNISSVPIEIPEWANITTPNPIPTPGFPAQPTPSPTKSPTPSTTSPAQSPSPSPSPSAPPASSPSESPMLTPTPSPSPLVAADASPTVSPSETPSPIPSTTEEPTQSPSFQPSPFPMEAVYALAGVAVAIVAVVAVALILRKRR